jgi:hypothetical protein
MQRLEVSGAVRPIYGSLGVKRLINTSRSDFQKTSVYARYASSSDITREFRSCQTWRYKKSRNKNRVRSQNVWPRDHTCTFTMVTQIP